MKKPTRPATYKPKVHIVVKTLNDPYEPHAEIVKVFKGTRKKAAVAWAEQEEQKTQQPRRATPDYYFELETWEVE